MASIGIHSFYIFMMVLMCFELCHCEMFKRTVIRHEQENCTRSHSKIVCNYIPKDLPAGIETVRLINIDGDPYPNYTLPKGTFSSNSWSYVKALEISAENRWLDTHSTVRVFDSSCFVGLRNLEQLHISISDYFRFMSGTLFRLVNLKYLDIVGCSRFYIDDLINSLNHPNVVPNIQRLNISRLNTIWQGITLPDKFFKLVSDKNIKELDMSAIQVLFANFTAFLENCGTLEYLNLSRILLSNLQDATYPRLCSNLKYVDLSFAVLPSNMIACRGIPLKTISNRVVPFNLNWLIWTRPLKNVEYIDLSGILPETCGYIIENVTVFLQGASGFNLKTLILRNNRFERLNMKVYAKNTTLKAIDLSGCNIRFLHPGTLSSFDALRRLDLSNNNLNEMMAEDSIHLGNLFRKFSKLYNLNLAGNEFTQLPRDIFKFNVQLGIIDLSNNMFSHITFDTRSLKNVVFLNLTRNSIKTLDDASMKRLRGLISLRNTADNDLNTPPLLLKDNPISCKDCDSFAFLDWLMKSEFLSEIKCVNEHLEHVYLSPKVITHVKAICERPKVIIMSCAALTAAILVAIGVAIVVRRYRRQRIYELEMEERIALIREGAEEHQFVVFLSYCSKDDLFVHNYVYNSLNEKLQQTTGEDRDLVCEGDRNFQLGRPIHDQISMLLKKSSVVVVVLTNNYSRSVHCRNEFDQAFMLEKPIVLMVKDEVDTELMTPLIRDIYEKKTRILWKYENGTYVLKTSWENVCTSIIELMESK